MIQPRRAPRVDRARAICVLAVCALGLLGAGRAAASGLGIPDLGTEAMGEGSAQIASPGNLSALVYNPAGLAALERPQIQLDFRLAWHRVGFQRLDASGNNPQGFYPVGNSGAISLTSAAPTGGFALPIPQLPFHSVVSIGGFPFNGATGYQYPDPRVLRGSGLTPSQVALQAPQRYSSILSASKIYIAAAAIAMRPFEWLDIGAELQLANASFSSTESVSSGAAPGEDSDLDAVLEINARDYFRPSGEFGFSARLPYGLVFGASYQLPYRFHATGTLGAYVPPTLQSLGATLEGSAATVSLIFPWYLRSGLRLVRPNYELELAGTVDGWSTLDNIRIDTQDVYIVLAGKKTALPTLILPQKMQNAGSVRLGGEVHLGELYPVVRGLTVRAGALYETSAVPDYRQTVSLPNWARASLSIGATYAFNSFSIAAAWSHFIQPERDIRDSEAKQVVALPGFAPAIVGNGNYTSQLDLFSLSVLMRL